MASAARQLQPDVDVEIRRDAAGYPELHLLTAAAKVWRRQYLFGGHYESGADQVTLTHRTDYTDAVCESLRGMGLRYRRVS